MNHTGGLKGGFRGDRNNKPQHQIIKPELVVEAIPLTFTYNPEDQPQRDGIAVNQFAAWWKQQVRQIHSYNHCYIQIYPEMSPTSRWHFHGTIMILDVANFYHWTVPRMMDKASIEIDVITHPEIWETYIMKQQDFIQHFVHRELRGPLVDYKSEKHKYVLKSEVGL